MPGLAALVCAALLAAPVWAQESKSQSAPPAVAPAKAAPAAASPAVAPKPATTAAKPAATTSKTVVVKPAPASTGVTAVPPHSVAVPPSAKAQGTTTASATKSTKVVSSAPPVPGPAAAGIRVNAQLDEQTTYHYNALGRRDPFQPLIGGAYVGVDVGGDAPPDVGGLKVVGIVWGEADKFAMVEDGRGESHVLRRGDKVMNGFVESLTREAVVVSLTSEGQTQSVTIPLTRKGDSINGNR
jgi:hypothetical protein